MPRYSSLAHGFLPLFLLLARERFAASDLVRINELSNSGTSGVCDGNDWIELYLPATCAAALDLNGYVLHDEKGADDGKAFTFPTENSTRFSLLNPGEYLLLCNDGPDPIASPQFGIGKSDELTLLDPSGAVVSSTGALQGLGYSDVSYALDEATDAFVYTSTPTPGEANVITAVPTEEEKVEEMRASWSAQNEMGTNFFNMDGKGMPVAGGFEAVVDLRMEMDPEVREQMREERSYKIYSPFLGANVTAKDDPENVLLSMNSPGRIRPKGQSTLVFGTCLDSSIPYSIDWDHTDPDQTLFGVQRSYMRTSFNEPSYIREWTMHRMLARFDLPHLRTRTVRFFLNGDFVGLYTLIEAPDQDYVFQRSFPDFNPEMYGLYKVKTLSMICGDSALAKALGAMGGDDEEVTPPYAFEKGDHRPKMPVLGKYDFEECAINFMMEIGRQFSETNAAYLQSDDGEKCGKFLVDHDLIGRKLGVQAVDKSMEVFINRNLADNKCDDKCSNSNLADDVDITNFLRNIAVMAALLHQDSPLGNGNNYYLAHTGADTKLSWAIFQYDHNGILGSSSAQLCSGQCLLDNLLKWSIVRPTCSSFETNQMAGPLLSDDALHARYIDYIREFVDNVMTDKVFLDQIHNHLEALQDDITKDSWGMFAQSFSLELAQDDQWLHMFANLPYIPFLPAVRARATEIKKQLQALDAGSFPRDLDDILHDETCVVWEAEGPPCPDMCKYEGCHGPEFQLVACDTISGECYHGLNDFMCVGVDDRESYEGMEKFEGSDQPPFCSSATFRPMKMEQCREKPVEEDIVKDPEESETDEDVTEDPKEAGKDEGTSSGSNLPHNLYDFAVAVFCLAVVIAL